MHIKKLMIVVACIISLIGCSSGQNAEMNQNTKQNIEQENAERALEMKEKGKYPISTVKNDNIVGSQYGTSEYAAAYPDIPALTENSEVIVYGEVVDGYFFSGANGLFRVIEDVEILQVIKGDFQEGDIIKVTKDQGIVSVKDYISSFTNEEAKEAKRQEYAEYSDEELEDIYLQQLCDYDVLSEIGQKGVYFLEESSFYDEEGTYARLTDSEGEYLEIGNNQFALMRSVGMNSYSSVTYASEVNEPEDAMYSIYTLNEIISAANQRE